MKIGMLILASSITMAFGAECERIPLVVVGHIQYVEQKTSADYERDRRLYVHDNAQYLAIRVDRVIVGEQSSNSIVVRVDVDDDTAPGITWHTRSYGILDPKTWHSGAKVVLFLDDSKNAGKKCPSLWVRDRTFPNETSLGHVLGYWSEDLEPFRGAPEYCESVINVLPVHE